MLVAVDQPACGAVHGVEGSNDQDGVGEKKFPDMPEDVMAHLVAHDKEQFRFVKLSNGRVPEDDPLRSAQASDIGIHTFRVLALVDFEDTASFNPGALGQLQNTGFERLVFHRLELVKQWGNPDRLDQDNHQKEWNGQQAGVEPPATRALSEQEIRRPQEENTY